MLLDRLQRLLPRRYEATAAEFVLRGGTRFCLDLVDAGGCDVLDVGSSIGWFPREALARGARSVTAVDASGEALAVARRTVPGVTFVEADALDLPFADGSFDLVTMFNIVEHLPKNTEERMLREGARVLRPGGKLALVTPNRHPLPTLADPAWYLGHRHYSASAMTKLFAAAGLEVERVVIGGGVADTADLLLYYTWRHLFRRELHPFERVRRRADAELASGRGRNHLGVVGRRAGIVGPV